MNKPRDPRPRPERRAAQKQLVQEIRQGKVEIPADDNENTNAEESK